MFSSWRFVLGLARTGLIFTRIQEGAQPGGLTQPHLAKQSRVFHTVCLVLGSGGGERGSWNSLAAREHGRRSCPGEQLCGSCGLCRVFSSVSSLLLFLLLAVLLNCPYPDPPVFCLFFFPLLRTLAGGGATTWRFCCWPQPKPEQDSFHTPDSTVNTYLRRQFPLQPLTSG